MNCLEFSLLFCKSCARPGGLHSMSYLMMCGQAQGLGREMFLQKGVKRKYP